MMRRGRGHVRAKGRVCDAIDPKGKMNTHERRRALELEAAKQAGIIHDWGFERITLKLADDCRYTPDYTVIEPDGTLRFEEVKGFLRDDAKVKMRVAAAQFPEFRFTMFRLRPKKAGGGWEEREF